MLKEEKLIDIKRNNMEKNIYQKLEEARKLVKESVLKKRGRNSYSNYDYYTPEQVEILVAYATEKTKTIVLCNLKQDENGYYQTLDLVNLEDTEQQLHFELRTEKGSMKATNDAQQMGGTDTYSERYLKMKVFHIKDNNLDPDSQDNRVKKDIPLSGTVNLPQNGTDNLDL